MKWVVVVAVVLLAGCTSSSAGDKPHIVFIGDSITDIATPAIHRHLDGRYSVDVLAVDGERIDQRLPALRSAVANDPNAVVENLGTNDALQGGMHHNWMTSWNEMISITRNTSCVVLTTVNLSSDQYGQKMIARKLNADIMALAASNPRKYKVVDWSGFLGSVVNGNWRNYLRAELVHPTPAGGEKIASLDEVALAKCQL